MRPYRFGNGDALVYSLVSEKFDNGIRNYVIQIEQFITEEAWEALKQDRGLLKKCWRTLRLGVDRAASFDFYIQIAIAIGIVSILLASKIVSPDMPQINNRPPVPEQQAPK